MECKTIESLLLNHFSDYIKFGNAIMKGHKWLTRLPDGIMETYGILYEDSDLTKVLDKPVYEIVKGKILV